MADEADFNVDATPSLQQLIEFFSDSMFDVTKLARLEVLIANALQKGATVAHGAQHAGAQDVFSKLENEGDAAYQKSRRFLAWSLSHVVAHLLGVEVPPDALGQPARAGADSVVGRAIGETFLGVLRPEGGELQPGDEGAVRLIGVLTQFALNTWFEGTIVEEMISWLPAIGHAEEIGKLGQQLISATGLDELGRLAFRPLANVTVTAPLTWQANKRYRPNLLSEGEIIKAFYRGDYTGAEAAEELARLGYSDRRQDMLIKSAAKRATLEQLLTLQREGTLDRGFVLASLRDDGYDEATAQNVLVAAESTRHRSIVDDSLAAIVTAYVNRDLDDGQFRSFLPAIIADADEQGWHETTARTRRDLNVKHLSHAEVIECIKLLVLPFTYYRVWLDREGYPPDEATALEVLLQLQIDKQTTADDARRRIEEQRAKDKALADAAKAARLKTIEEQRALQRRGSIADLTRAVVRGLIPIDRLVEVLQQDYDADTVQILSDTALAMRADFVAQQKAADAARQRAAQRSIDVGALESAVLENVLTIEQFRQALAARDFVGADVDVLAATLTARKKDLDAARAKRAAADDRAKTQRIDLGRAEQLVIRGHGTLAQYDALLQTLGFDTASRAAMVDLLQLKVNDYAQAQAERAAGEARLKNKGISVDAMHRGVVLGLRTSQDYQALLVQNGFTAAAVALLVAEADADAAEAAAARKRRHDAEAAAVGARLSLDRVARAARLGIVTPAAYRDRLLKAGYSADDVAIDLDLLVVEIADEKARQATRDQLVAQTGDRGLSLQQLAAAVKAGAATIDDYRARAASLNYAPADVELLVAVLQSELDVQADAEARRTTIDGELATRQISLTELEAAVGANLKNLAQYQQQLEQWGYASSDAQLLASLLATKLAAQRAKGQ